MPRRDLPKPDTIIRVCAGTLATAHPAITYPVPRGGPEIPCPVCGRVQYTPPPEDRR